MAKNKKNSHRNRRRAGSNPHGHAMRHHHRRRSSRNPFMGESLGLQVKRLLAGAAGLLADVYVPAWLLGMMGQADTGWMSYLLAAGVVLAPSYLLHKSGMTEAAKAYFFGSGAGLVWRVVDDFTGTQYVTVQSGTGMGSMLVPGSYVLPGANVFQPYLRGRSQGMVTAPSGPSQSSSAMSVSSPISKGTSYFAYGS